MKLKLAGLVRLTRIKEYLFFVTVTTLLGVTAGNGSWGMRLVAVLLANILAVGFSFMINDVEDADDDALNPQKVMRNPVSAQHITPRAGWIASWIGVWPGISALSQPGMESLRCRFYMSAPRRVLFLEEGAFQEYRVCGFYLSHDDAFRLAVSKWIYGV